MKPHLPALTFRSIAARNTGAALIITLAVLVLMAIMVVSLSDMMRMERSSAHSHVEKMRAELFSQKGVEDVVGTLQMATADTNRNWISEPGQLVAGSPTGSATANGDPRLILKDPAIPLSSGAPDSSLSLPAYLKPINLNVSTFEPDAGIAGPSYLIDPAAQDPTDPTGSSVPVQMMLKWVYVRADGSRDTSENPDTQSPDAAPDKQIVGRYAYWTDDESSKVNYNLAWTRSSSNPTPQSHPSHVNLPTLFGGGTEGERMAAAIHLYQAAPNPTIPSSPPATISAYDSFARFFYSTPQDARQVEDATGGSGQGGKGVYTALDAAKFNVTHYSNDPDTTFFNQQRIVLTTHKSLAGNRPFLDIGTIDNIDLGDLSNISSSKLTTTINLLNSYLQRTDWPMLSPAGGSLQSKYYAGLSDRLTQLSLNIIDYVRSKESARPLVIPLRGTYLSKVFTIAIGTDPNSYIGITRGPRTTEMGIFIPAAPKAGTAKTYTAKVKLEVFLPLNFGVKTLDLKTVSLYLDAYLDDGSNTNQGLHAISALEATLTAAEVSIPGHAVGDTIMKAGERAVISRNVDVTYTQFRPTAASTAKFRFAIAQVGAAGVSNRLDVTPLLGGTGDYAVCKVNAPNVSETDMPSIEVDDPRVNSHRDDWKQVAKNTFGAINSVSTIGAAPNTTYVPEQDVDKGGKVTDVSLVIPNQAKVTDTTLSSNPTGIVESVGELGFISTGMQSAGMAGTPWRTLHLQPSKQGTGVVPDWAFMDLFTVPADVPVSVSGKPSPKAFYSPHDTATGGRVNMNAKPAPFALNRTLPLQAVFEGARYNATNTSSVLSASQAKTIAQNVYNHTLTTVSNALKVPGKNYGYTNGYDSPGEVVEMQGVADGGEESEQLVRSIANLITARGNVFSIYAVGQAIKQTRILDPVTHKYKLIITGEQRQQAMVERYATTNPLNNKPDVKFRTVYFRNLTP